MSDTRYFKDVARINGRPALVNVTVHPSGRRFVDLKSIDYLDVTEPADAPDPTPEPYRSPMPAILSILAIVWSISCAILGAATFGTDPLTLAPFLGGMAWWGASVALGWYAYRAIRAALR